jgi:hypothetical protein
MKKIVLPFFLLFSLLIHAQNSNIPKLGQTSIDELLMTTYDKDSSAVAVVLYEKGNHFTHKTQRNIQITDYYYRVKILKNDGLDQGTIKIPILGDERVTNIRGHSWHIDEKGNIKKNLLSEDDIIRSTTDDVAKEVIMNIPNVRIGSVIEYSYRVTSPYFFIRDWSFQNDIPKIRSDFETLLEYGKKYHTRFVGVDSLGYSRKDTVIDCFAGSAKRERKCRSSFHRMDSIKSFEPEVLMVSPETVMPSLSFQLRILADRYGRLIYRGIPNWREFDLGFQYFLTYFQKDNARFYRRKLPNDILKASDTLEKAKGIYYFLQDHYTWNRNLKGGLTSKIRRQFKDKKGSVNLINSSLYGSLTSAGIKCNYVMVSTRGNGIPDKEFPNLDDFNYLLVKATIGGEDYFLDATEKNLAFGLLPMRILNTEGRVFDFSNKSYWQKLAPKETSTKNSTVKLAFDEDMSLTGTIAIEKYGMDAYLSRTGYKELGKERYLELTEELMKKLEIDSLEVENTDDLEKHFIEKYSIFIDSEDVNQMVDSENVIRFSPVFFDQLSENPFKSNTRNYDLDFLYKRKNIYRLSIQIPEGYEVTKLPENVSLNLPSRGGTYVYRIQAKDNQINLYIRFYLKKDQYSVFEYANLKKLHEKIIKAEEAFVELKKIEE